MSADVIRDIAAELERGDVSLRMLKFERESDGETVTTIIVSTHKTGENKA